MMNSKILVTIILVLCFALSGIAYPELTDGLVGYWPLDEGEGLTANDISGNGHNGTLTANDIDWYPGAVGGAVDCYGSDFDEGFINIPQHDDLKPENITVQAWVNLDSIRTWDGIVGNFEDTGDVESGWALFIYGDTVGFYVSVGGAMKWTQVSLTLGEWTHLVGTYDGTDVKLYKNAEAPVVGAGGGPIDYSEFAPLGMRIGQYYDSNEQQALNGRVDEVALWNRALDEIEVASLYNNGTGRNVMDMVIPTPSNGATGIPIIQILSWTDPNFAPIGYDVYFGTDANELSPDYDFDKVVDNELVNSYDPEPDLDFDTTYYWRVDIYEPNDPQTILHIGRVWNFTTSPPVPGFDPTYPADVLIAVGEDASFTVVAINPYTGDDKQLLYQWYKAPDILLSNGADYAGTDTSQLTVFAADLADEGDYFCQVEIKNTGATADSPSAGLFIKKIIGHWPFDGNLDDIVGGNNGSSDGAVYQTGIIDSGQAAAFDGNGNGTISVPTAAHQNLSYTLSWWDNSDPAGTPEDWESMLASGPELGWEVFEFDRYGNTIYTFGFNWDVYVDSPFALRGAWNYHAVTYDAQERIAKWYYNGLLLHQIDSLGFGGFDTLIFVGNSRDGSQPFNGLIDDLRLYNYSLDKYEVATLFAEGKDQGVCADPPQADLSGDCLVTLEDFVFVASEWLECGRIPETACP